MRIQQQIEQKLIAALAPQRLALSNESHSHNVPEGSESHFNAIIVAEAFEGKSLVQRHRAVYGAIGEELRNEIHAFTMKTYTPREWQATGGEAENPAPKCRGGAKREGLFQG